MPPEPRLTDLRESLATFNREDPEGDRLAGFVTWLSPFLPELIRDLLASEENLARVASRSYPHHNGFDRIELCATDDPASALRLHVWWGDTNRREHIHGHPWNFGSTVLAGVLHYEHYVEDTAGEELHEYHYPRPTGAESYRLLPTGHVVRLRPLVTGWLPAGAAYRASHSLLHRVWARPGKATATLMLHGAGIAFPSRVFAREPPGELLGAHAVRRFTPDELRIQLQRVLAILKNTHLRQA